MKLVQWGGQDLSGRMRLVEPTAFARRSNLGVKSNGTAIQVSEGLTEGAVVITHPSDRVHDGVQTATR